MTPGGARANSGRAAVARTRPLGEHGAQEESIYGLGASPGAGELAGPRVRTYHVSPAAAASPGTGQPPPKPRMHADSSQVSAALNPVRGVRDAQMRQGIKPADHSRSNKDAVREASQFNALRKAAAAGQEQVSGGRPHALPRSASTPLPAQQRPRSGHTPPSGRVSGSGGGAGTSGGGAGDRVSSGRNFLAENRAGAAAAPVRQVVKPPSDDGLAYLAKRDYGRVPSYLLQRKVELAEAAAQVERDKEAALIPPGMRLLGEEERQDTLALLARNKVDVERALQSLPIIIETPSAVRRKNELEARLKEIEDATKVFSRPKVLVTAI